MSVPLGLAQQSITTSGIAVEQSFDGLGSSAAASLPIGWRVGTDWTTGATSTSFAYGTSGAGIVSSTSSGGIVNWANGVTASSTLRALGFLNTGSFTSPRSIIYAFQNDTGGTVTSLTVTWTYEKYRSGTRAWNWTFFHGNTSAASTAAADGDLAFPGDVDNTTVSNPPTATPKNVTIAGLNIPNGSIYYLRWTLTGVGGSSNGQGLGINNFAVTLAGASGPTITASPAVISGLIATQGVPAAGTSFTASGANLTANITVAATDPVNFAVSTNSASGYADSLTLTNSSGTVAPTPVFVRLTAAAQGTFNSTVNLSGGGATATNVSVGGTVSAPPVSLGWTGTLTNFATLQGVSSPVQTLTLAGAGITNASVVVSATGGVLELATNGTDFSPSLSVLVTNGAVNTDVLIRVSGSAPLGGPVASTITASGAPALPATTNANVTVSANPNPFIVATPGFLDGFFATEGTPSTNLQTFTVGATNLAGNLNILAPAGYQVSTNGIDFVSSLALVPVGGTPVVTNLAIDDGNNYASGWTNGANGGTGFGAWNITVNDNAATNPPPAYFAGVFIGNPTAAGITTNATFGTNAFGMYANPAGSAASATADRTFAALQNGQTFSFQWGVNWDSEGGNKGFSLYTGGTSGLEVVNVNMSTSPDITFNGQAAVNGTGTNFGTLPMTWSFSMTSATNLFVSSTARNGTNIAFSTNITVAAGPDSLRWYVSAMGAGDQRQPYYNNLNIVGTAASGNVAPTIIYVRLAGAASGSAAGNVNLTSLGAPPKTVALSGTVLPRPVITPTASLTPFAADLGTNSAAQPFTFVGTNLVGDVTLTAPAGYEISKTTNGTYSNTLVYALAEAQPGPATNWVRLAANAPAGIVAGNIALASKGAVTTNVPVTGLVTGDPVIFLAPTNLTNFFAPLGAPSDPQSFIARGVDLDGDIVLTASNSTDWEIRDPADGVYKTSVTLTASAPGPTPVTLAEDNASNYGGSWTDGSTGGSGFGPWTIATEGDAATLIGDPAVAGIAGMSATSFALQGTTGYATATRSFGAPMLPGDTFSLQWGNNFDTGGGGNKGVNIYAGGFAEANQLVNINMGGGATITINGQPMFTNYGTAAVTLNFQYVAPGQLRVFGTGRNGTETYDRTFAVSAPPDGFRLYAGDLSSDNLVQRVAYANNFTITSGSVGPSVDPTEILVRIKDTAPVTPLSPPGQVLSGSVVTTSPGAADAAVSLEGLVSDTPEITNSSSFVPFLAVQGFPSAPQTFTVGGNNLEAGVLVAPPMGYEVSPDGNTWSDEGVTVPRDGIVTPQQKVYVRIAPTTPVGAPGGNILLTSPDAPDVTIPVTGTVAANTGPQLAANPAILSGLYTQQGTPSASSTNFALTGQGLTNIVSVVAPAGFEVSTNNGVSYANTLNIAPPPSGSVSNNLFVRLSGAGSGILKGAITNMSSGAVPALVQVSGTVATSGNPIVVSPTSLTNFFSGQGTPSAAQPLTIGAGTNVNVTINRAFEFATSTNGAYATNGSIDSSNLPTTIYVRLAGTNAPGATNGVLEVATPTATNNVPLSGGVSSVVFSPASLQPFQAQEANYSAAQRLAVTMSYLDGDVVLEAPVGAQISLSQGEGYGDTVRVSPVNGSATQIIWVRMYVAGFEGAWSGDLQAERASDGVVLANLPLSGQVFANALVPTFAPPAPDGPVRAFTSDPQSEFLYVGGQFARMGTNAARGVAKLSAIDGSVQTNFVADPGGNVSALAYGMTAGATNAWIYVAGRFATVTTNNDVATTNISLLKRLNAATGAADPSFTPDLLGTNSVGSARATALAFTSGGQLVVGGTFDGGIKMVNPTNGSVTALPVALGGGVQALAVQTDGKILIGGSFSRGIARLTPEGMVDSTFVTGVGSTGGFNGSVNAIAVDTTNGTIYVGGSFSSYSGINTRNMLAALDASGVLQGGFNFLPGINNTVNALVVEPDGDVLAGGEFILVGNALAGFSNVNVGRVVRFKPTGQLDASFNQGGSGADNNAVFAMAALRNGNVAVGGSFTGFNNNPALARLALLAGTPGPLPSVAQAPRVVEPNEVADPVVVTPSAVDTGGADEGAVPGQSTTPTEDASGASPPAEKIGFATTTAVASATSPGTMANAYRGTYVGLVAQSAVNKRNGGGLNLTVDARGQISGQLHMNGRKRALRGSAQPGKGVLAARTVSVRGQPDYVLRLKISNPGKSPKRFSGHLAAGRKKYAVSVLATPWSAAKSAQAFVGTYKIALQGPTGRSRPRQLPAGDGAATLTIRPNGNVQLMGRLPGRRAFQWSGRLAADGTIPVHAMLGGQSALSGTLRITPRTRAVSGVLLWNQEATRQVSSFRASLGVRGQLLPAPRKLSLSEPANFFQKKCPNPLALSGTLFQIVCGCESNRSGSSLSERAHRHATLLHGASSQVALIGYRGSNPVWEI